MKKKFDLVVVGELNVDLILNGIDSLPRVGTEILAREMDLTLGSSSAILASNISMLGISTAFIGKIGRDSFGDLVIGSLRAKQVDTSMIRSSDTGKTGATIVMNYDNDRAMVTHPGAMEELSGADISDDDLGSAGHLHVSSIFLQPGIRKDILSLFRRAKRLGLTTSLDPQWDPEEKWDVDFKSLLPFVDIFLPNNNEIVAIARADTVEEAVEQLLPHANTIALKMGRDGSAGYRDGETLIAKPFLNEQVVDAIGAGDSFNAGYLSAFIQKRPMRECLERGNIIGAVNTTGIGGTGAFTDLETVRKTAREKFGYSY